MRLNNLALILVCWFSAFPSYGTEIIPYKGSSKQAKQDYLAMHRRFFKQLCPGGEDQKYLSLLSDYRGEGYFIPIINEKSLDRKTIRNYIPELKKKIAFISFTAKKLKSYEKFEEIPKRINFFQDKILRILDLKRDLRETDFESIRRRVSASLKSEVEILNNEWKHFMGEIFFLLGYSFPVDHLYLRQNYDKYKNFKDIKNKRKANEFYFYRKIVEDGAQDKNHRNSDKYLRAALNTIFVNFEKSGGKLTEDIRYDLTYALRKIERLVKLGKEENHSRLEEWEQRTKETLEFYQRLLRKNKKDLGASKKLLLKKSKTRFAIEKFNAQKQLEVYRFFQQESEINRALYVLETILFNEVGEFDGKDALERRDVAQVVLNRRMRPFYTQLDKDQMLYSEIRSKLTKDIDKFPWLNVMFRKGEFSFTYFFIGSSYKVYCPDMSRNGRRLREKNLDLVIDLLQKPNWDFQAMRYFSRASMLGKIDMTTLWSDFELLPERKGNPVSGRVRATLGKAYREGTFHFLYSFKDDQEKTYEVILVDDEPYVMTDNEVRPFFYKYRNPHYFKYFKKK